MHSVSGDGGRPARTGRALGIDRWLDWEFQQDDLVELLLKPLGTVVAWEQGCGKSRLAVALILLSGVRHGLIVVESRLISELQKEFAKLDLPCEAVHIINGPEDLGTLSRINLISYERLRMVVDRRQSLRATYAHRLRRRIGLLVADEGERLANPMSDQSRALWQLSARRRYVLTGSPIPNYPRDVFGLIAFTGGDGTAAQPYGYRRGYLQSNWLATVQHAVRGIEQFRNDFVVLEWVTWQFAESLQDGAKREVPKIGNLPLYRQMLAPHVKRRLVCEPEVARYIQIDDPISEVVETEWDPGHLAVYMKAADEFADWYRTVRGDGRANNLLTILARIRAVHFAANYPQHGLDGVERLHQLTSKQRAVIDRMEEISVEGKKAILFAENPGVIRLIGSELAKRGVETVPFHGDIPISKRVADKDKRFVGVSQPACYAPRRPVGRATTCRWQTMCSFTIARGPGASSTRRCAARCVGTARACSRCCTSICRAVSTSTRTRWLHTSAMRCRPGWTGLRQSWKTRRSCTWTPCWTHLLMTWRSCAAKSRTICANF